MTCPLITWQTTMPTYQDTIGARMRLGVVKFQGNGSTYVSGVIALPAGQHGRRMRPGELDSRVL